MSTLLSLTLAVLALSPALAGPKHAPAPKSTRPAAAKGAPPAAPAEATPVVEGLRARAKGAPLLLVLTEKGAVVARTPDGAFEEVLVEGPVDDAAWDARREVLWLRTKDKVEALDLRLPAPKRVRIAEKVPEARLAITWGMLDSTYSARMTPELVFIGLESGEPAIHGNAAPLEMDEAVIAAFQEKVGRAELVGADWLRAEAGRPARPEPESRWLDPKRKITLPADVACADDASWPVCGAAIDLGPWLLVVESVSCGDACWTECRLYDPATNTPLATDPRTAAPAALPKAASCGLYETEPTGGWYLFPESYDPVVCAFSGGCHRVPGLSLGWLDPGAELGAESY